MRTRQTPTFFAAPLALLLLVALALALPAVGSAAEPGGIAGTVTAEGGGSIGNAEVCAYGLGVGTEEESCVPVGVAGEYEIAALPVGQYMVEFLPSDPTYIWQYYNGTQDPAAITPVTVAESVVTPNIDAALPKAAQISGRVIVAATGLPQAGAEVCAVQMGGPGLECVFVNDSGGYTIEGLAAGQWDVYFFPSVSGLIAQAYLNKELIETPTPIPLTPGHTQEGIDAALRPGGAIGGTVRLAATDAPLAGVRVCLVEAEFLEPVDCLTSPPSGGYRFGNLPKDSYKVVFSASADEVEDPKAISDPYPTEWWSGQSTFATATPIAVTPPATVLGIDAHLGPPPVTATSQPTTAAPVVAKLKPKRKPLRCRRGFAKRKVRGKPRCVKRHKVVRHRKHHKKRPQ